MNTTKYLLIACFFSLLLGVISGCKKDWLGVKADKNQAVPSTLKDLQALLNNEGEFNNESASTLAELASDGHYTTEAAWTAGTQSNPFNAYTWANNRVYAVNNWRSYSRVFAANIVLDALKTINPKDALEQKLWNDIKGQALFHRSDSFYRIAQVWGMPYNPVTANNDLGIPLRLEADVTLVSVRSSVKQTYDQIIGDLIEARKLLPNNFVAKTRPFMPAVFAQLSRVYLSMRNYEKAKLYADSCLQLSSSLLDFNTLSTTATFIGATNNNPEVIFSIQISTAGTNNFLLSACFIDQDLYNSYTDNDLRKVIFVRKNPDNTASFRGNYNNSASSLFGGLATDEIYLTRAECYARAGETVLAMRDLNDLLRSRWKKVSGVSTYVNQTAFDANDALKIILKERRKELLLRGLRWTDLRRLNFEETHKTTLTRTIGGTTYTLEPGSFRYTFPIPDEVIAISGLKQNPGW